MKSIALIPEERVAQAIFVVRGQKVMLDSDLAKLYWVSTGNLNKAVDRNKKRFPQDFAFRLTSTEFKNILVFQFGRSNSGSRGGTRHLPFVFTEHGVAMLSSVLRSERAVQINIAIMRTFAKLRQLLSSDKDLVHKLEEHDRKLYDHDQNIRYLVIAIRRLMSKPEPKRNPIGFGAHNNKKK